MGYQPETNWPQRVRERCCASSRQGDVTGSRLSAGAIVPGIATR